MKPGISNLDHIIPIVKIIVKAYELEPMRFTVLDVGCGRGVYGYVLRSFLGDHKRLYIDGVEPQLETQWLNSMRYIYDGLYKMTVQQFLDDRERLDGYTVILANHVMEHIGIREAINCMQFFQEIGELVLIGLPRSRHDHEYSDAEGNEFETHKWGHRDIDFQRLGFKKATHITDNELYYWSSDSEKENLYIS